MAVQRLILGVVLVVLCVSNIPFMPAVLLAIVGTPAIEALMTPKPPR